MTTDPTDHEGRPLTFWGGKPATEPTPDVCPKCTCWLGQPIPYGGCSDDRINCAVHGNKPTPDGGADGGKLSYGDMQKMMGLAADEVALLRSELAAVKAERDKWESYWRKTGDSYVGLHEHCNDIEAELAAAKAKTDELKEVWLPCDQTIQCAVCLWCNWPTNEDGTTPVHSLDCPVGYMQARWEKAESELAAANARAEAAEKERDRFKVAILKSGIWKIGPCCLCGYNGAGYFQPNIHKCAAPESPVWI